MDILRKSSWEELFERIPLLEPYGPEDRTRLRDLAERFLRRKSLEAAGALELTTSMSRVIGAFACVPILGLGLDWYAGWKSVIVYPAGFLAPHSYEDEAGVVHEAARALAGEAWARGPVVLSWEQIEEDAAGATDGNLVIHEMAHKLDLLDGVANGRPPLRADMDPGAWVRSFSTAYADLLDRLETDEPSPLDEGAADDPAEFFAVASETFFTTPGWLSHSYPDVYAQLRLFYRQDPAGRAGRG